MQVDHKWHSNIQFEGYGIQNFKKKFQKNYINFLLPKYLNILIGKKSKNFTIFDFIIQKWLDVIEWVDTFFEKNNACKIRIFYFGLHFLALSWYICNRKWSFLLHKMIKKHNYANILKSAKKCEKPILRNCSPTCVLSSGYITFCRNLQKWNLSWFENAYLAVFLLNC